MNETATEFETRLMNLAREQVQSLVGKVNGAAELKAVQLLGLALTLSMSDRVESDTLNSIHLLLDLVKKLAEQRSVDLVLGEIRELAEKGLTPANG